MKLKVNSVGMKGQLIVPGDKSISHRSIMLASIATGETVIEGFLKADDCLSTISMFRNLGVEIYDEGNVIRVLGKGIKSFKKPNAILDVGNSGTTMRLGLGILAQLPFETVLTGDESLNNRPMERVMAPIREMGATVYGNNQSEFAPITIIGNENLNSICYDMPMASAQVKSAIILAALGADGTTKIIEKTPSRNHTEEMLVLFDGELNKTENTILVKGNQSLSSATNIKVPGDISSAAYFLVAAAIIPNSKLTIKNVGINNSRTGIIDVLKLMGANITVEIIDKKNQLGHITVSYSQLKAITIEGALIPRLIDELPIIALLATQVTGTTVIKDAHELKYKETNRIDVTAQELGKLGAKITASADGLIIDGPNQLHGSSVSSHGDHRIGMTLAIAALLVEKGEVELDGSEAVAVSYPDFFKDIENSLIGGE